MTAAETKFFNSVASTWLNTRSNGGIESLGKTRRELHDFLDLILPDEFVEQLIEDALMELDDRFINKDPR